MMSGYQFHSCLNKLCLLCSDEANVCRLHVKCFIIEEYTRLGINGDESSLVDSE